ncbi:anti-sigma factor [Paenisporosarcina quisquiliarum]|uniref:Anti-sigma-W factor RsiW n=1 Tax=Paenisporosarcina quisquiliarum TaxID=365346 RepID=A0A9X3RDT4_9BACL|nr:anti-sigma factor [Paenisporosarcina quisquiliarum]MCZ8536792.1 anti-sigma factor [Paenisporosarcina quisquiliarum]
MDRQMCNQLVDYFNEQLSEVEKHAFEKHLASCEDCQVELAEWQALTEDLPYVSATTNPPEGMKERILSAVFEEETSKEPVANVGPVPVLPVRDIDSPMKKNRVLSWFPAVAAALMLSLGTNIFLASLVKNQQEDLVAQGEAVDQLLAYVNLTPVEGNASGTASIVKHGDETRVVVQASSLPELSNDEVYQVWLIDEEGPKRAGTFKSDSQEGAVVFTLPKGMDRDWTQVAVSHEPNAESETPLGNVLMASNFK